MRALRADTRAIVHRQGDVLAAAKIHRSLAYHRHRARLRLELPRQAPARADIADGAHLPGGEFHHFVGILDGVNPLVLSMKRRHQGLQIRVRESALPALEGDFDVPRLV